MNKHGLEPVVMPTAADETITGDPSMTEVVEDLSHRKALACYSSVKEDNSYAGYMIVAADTIVYKDGIMGKPEDAEVKNYTPGEMLRTSRFWFFTIWAILLNSAGLLVINSAANISVAFGGTAVLGMIVSLFNGAGRIVAGNNFDRHGRFMSTLVNNAFMLAAGILLVLGGMTGAYAFILCGLVFVGLAYGGCPTITSAYINKAFGPANFATNFSIANFSLIPAATIGPMISSALLESAGGSYDTNFYAIVGFSLAAAVFWLLLQSERLPFQHHFHVLWFLSKSL